ncbi:hypothetical protein [Actinomadura atramentaria]|uniref:hypothetical protein n=1 Tax=Actinomadura atramentaria TaxID=1990 RepID=UPI0003716D6E|nr:hypothetical protein [Actinomadura atramentaria]
MLGDSVEILMDQGGGVERHVVAATCVGRSVEIDISDGMVKVREIARGGRVMTEEWFPVTRVVHIVKRNGNRRPTAAPTPAQPADTATTSQPDAESAPPAPNQPTTTEPQDRTPPAASPDATPLHGLPDSTPPDAGPTPSPPRPDETVSKLKHAKQGKSKRPKRSGKRRAS